MVSVQVMCVIVMECAVEYREMCYVISVCNVCNGDGVYNTIQRNVLTSEQKLPYSCVLYRPNSSCHTAVCVV